VTYKSRLFNGTDNFTYCIIDESRMSYFYDALKNLKYAKRDCSTKCFNHNRVKGENPHVCNFISCIDNSKFRYYYKNNCYETCPSKTILSSKKDYECDFLNCSIYYNYTQKGCINKIPEGYYLNDTLEKTIDKCHPNCKTCFDKETLYNNNNCETCPDNKYYYGKDCVDNCPDGFYIDIDDSSKKKCYCTDKKCSECSYESLNNEMCISCNNSNNYYPILAVSSS
jgi:hypothetical protein